MRKYNWVMKREMNGECLKLVTKTSFTPVLKKAIAPIPNFYKFIINQVVHTAHKVQASKSSQKLIRETVQVASDVQIHFDIFLQRLPNPIQHELNSDAGSTGGNIINSIILHHQHRLLNSHQDYVFTILSTLCLQCYMKSSS